jgi:hypothetical protein
MSEPLLTLQSSIEGSKANVSIYVDRVEWTRQGFSPGKLMAGVSTGGLSLLATGLHRKDTTGSDVIPIKAITSVTTQRDWFGQFTVRIIASGTVVSKSGKLGNSIEFDVSREDAEIAKDLLTQLMLGKHPSQQAAARAIEQPAPTAVPSPQREPDTVEQIKKLAELRDAGILSDDEFQAKKADLLGRM